MINTHKNKYGLFPTQNSANLLYLNCEITRKLNVDIHNLNYYIYNFLI